MGEPRLDSNNVWKLTTRMGRGEDYYVRNASKSGAKIYLGTKIGRKDTPFYAELIDPEDVPEGKEIMQASFPHPADPRNWKEDWKLETRDD